jgi:hypothetical protein
LTTHDEDERQEDVRALEALLMVQVDAHLAGVLLGHTPAQSRPGLLAYLTSCRELVDRGEDRESERAAADDRVIEMSDEELTAALRGLLSKYRGSPMHDFVLEKFVEPMRRIDEESYEQFRESVLEE